MDTINNANGDKPKVHKIEIAKRLYFLNHYIRELKQQIKKCEEESVANSLIAEMKELYILKNRVLIKMLMEGYARIRQFQSGFGGSYYIVRINRVFEFHIPITKYVREALDENAEIDINVCPDEQGI